MKVVLDIPPLSLLVSMYAKQQSLWLLESAGYVFVKALRVYSKREIANGCVADNSNAGPASSEKNNDQEQSIVDAEERNENSPNGQQKLCEFDWGRFSCGRG